MQPTPELIDELYRDKVRQAREMSPEEKFFAGPRLFDHVCRVMREGIREQYPEATEEEVEHMLQHRLAIAQKLEEWP